MEINFAEESVVGCLVKGCVWHACPVKEILSEALVRDEGITLRTHALQVDVNLFNEFHVLLDHIFHFFKLLFVAAHHVVKVDILQVIISQIKRLLDVLFFEVLEHMLTLVLVSDFDVVVSWVIVLRNEIRAESCQHLMNVERCTLFSFKNVLQAL